MPRSAEPPHDPTPGTMWSADEDETMAFDEDCSPTRVCRNARQFGFEGIADDGADLQSAWRDLLAREGKLSESGRSVRDLVLGPSDPS